MQYKLEFAGYTVVCRSCWIFGSLHVRMKQSLHESSHESLHCTLSKFTSKFAVKFTYYTYIRGCPKLHSKLTFMHSKLMFMHSKLMFMHSNLCLWITLMLVGHIVAQGFTLKLKLVGCTVVCRSHWLWLFLTQNKFIT